MKMLRCITIILFLPAIAIAQNKPLDYESYEIWKDLDNSQISNNGEYVSYEVNPQDGDGILTVQHPGNSFKKEFPRGKNAKFSPNSDFIAFTIYPYTDTVRHLKREDVKKENLPKDSMGIYVLEEKELMKVPRLKKYKVPEKKSSWLAYTYEPQKAESDTAEAKGEKDKKDEKNLHTLNVQNPVKGAKHTFRRVKSFAFSENGYRLGFVTVSDDSASKAVVKVFDTRDETLDSLPAREGKIKKVTMDHSGDEMAFIHSADTIDKKTYSLFYWNLDDNSSEKVVDTTISAIPKKWTVSQHGKIHFSKDDERLYFGTALKPEPEPEDTLLEKEKVKLDVWHWQDKRLQTHQLDNLKEDKQKNYTAVYHINDGEVVQLAGEDMPDLELTDKGRAKYALGENRKPYLKKMSYEWPPYRDIYQVNTKTGKREKILEEIQSRVEISPKGKYILWYNNADSCWYSYSNETGKTVNMTRSLDVPFYRVQHDYPLEASPYGYAGFTENDEYLLAYSRFDIWKLDPDGEEDPVNITNGYGADNRIQFRYVDLDKEKLTIDPDEDLLLRAFHKDNKKSGYYSTTIGADNDPAELIFGDYHYYRPDKAKKENRLIWRRSTVKQYPDLWISDREFQDRQKVTALNPQQDEYNWATVECIDYMTLDGKKEEALVYKPENFDPDKEYPVMVYFYRLHSDDMHRHYTPSPSYSIINPLFYASNGYIVLMPNIRYEIGYPGESAFNHVVGAAHQLATKDYVDEDNMGMQGQSWGGYEVAFIVTRTDMFKAASPGAPVANMTSAYGGIRWGSGLVRQFQYEESQSRIGGSLWDKPMRYIENSPLFYAPKIETPLLIRHDDDDGAVPWYQGIELFNAMRRLNKPAWLINYNDAPHNLTEKRANRKDWSKRMKQFFDHYLKGKTPPVWLEEGIPAIKKGETLGLEKAQ